jgi:carboxynorspermidine decarboxylase
MEGDLQVIDWNIFSTPSFVVDRVLLEKNLKVLSSVRERTGVKILLALKGFAMFATFPLIRQYLQGTCASSPFEARLGKEEFGGDVHAFAAAYSDSDFKDLLKTSNHIVFNSMSQYEHFLPMIKEYYGKISFGLRINPEHRETDVEIYDPCAPFSRLGITKKNFPERLPPYIDGLHMHTLCQKNSDSLERTVAAAEKNFGNYFKECKWVNFGGGHHITRDDYDIDRLCNVIENFKKRYNTEIYLEPGEAVALNAGFLVSKVLDITENRMPIAILDTSAATHMPDVLEMPYRPYILNSGAAGEYEYTYRLAGLSCLAGDVIGDYSFKKPLNIGDRVIFTDMAIYSMVKTNTFNGIKLPDIYYYDSESQEILHYKSFSYEDFIWRLS